MQKVKPHEANVVHRSNEGLSRCPEHGAERPEAALAAADSVRQRLEGGHT